MGEKVTQSKIMSALDWGYDKAINGVPGVWSAQDLAESYMKKGGTPEDQVKSLIRWQNAKSGTSGFLTGLGGVLTLPVALPANITSVLFIQIRMIAAIAHIAGFDVRDDRVQSLVYVCLTGNAAKEILKDTGIVIGTKISTNAVKSISGKTLTAINQKVGFRLFTKFGEKGAINIGKAVPLVGGIIGGSVDSVSTQIVGRTAKKTFILEVEPI